MSSNIGDIRNLTVTLNSHLGLYHVVLTIPKTSLEKYTLNRVELQRLLNMEMTYSKEELPCLKWIIYNGRRKVIVKFKTDTN